MFLAIKSQCLFPNQTHFKNRPSELVLPETVFPKFRNGPRYRNCILAKAEDKARENSERQLEVKYCAYRGDLLYYTILPWILII